MRRTIVLGLAIAWCCACSAGDDVWVPFDARTDDGGGEIPPGDADAPDDTAVDEVVGDDTTVEDAPFDELSADDGTADDAPPGPDPCAPIPGASYRSLSTAGPTTDRPPPEHADLNLALRGWTPTGGTLGLIDIDGPTDDRAPQLNAMFTDDRVPAFPRNYAVYNWDWGSNSRADVITEPEVTLAGFGTSTGEVLEVPNSGYDIGEGLQVRVLFLDEDAITLKYTREDNVVYGYTVHVAGICVEPALQALYAANDAAGRSELPALAGNQPFGRARGAEIQVAIRDTGSFMDPRSRKDWW
jgi:hypothetical protein